MGLDCSGSCMKYLLFLFNFIFFVVGAAILAVGIWAKIDPTATSYIGLTIDDSSSYDIALILLICVGAFIFLLGFLGCCGACKESACMLGTFAALLVLLVLVQVVAAILVAVFKGEVHTSIQTFLEKQVNEEYGDDTGITEAWDKMQEGLKCCGANNSKDWAESAWWNNQTNPAATLVPDTCCKDKHSPCQSDGTGDAQAYTTGCKSALENWINSHSAIIMGIGFGLAFIEIMGIVMACCVKKKIDAGDYYS